MHLSHEEFIFQVCKITICTHRIYFSTSFSHLRVSHLFSLIQYVFISVQYGYAEVNGTDVTSPTRACTVCHKPYTALSNFYQHLDLKWGSGLCMDIVDSVSKLCKYCTQLLLLVSVPVRLCACVPVRLCACVPVRLCACAHDTEKVEH